MEYEFFTYTDEQVAEEKRAIAVELYDALVSVMMSMADSPSTLLSETESQRLRREADNLDRRQEMFERAWKLIRKVHTPNIQYHRARN